MDNATSRVAGHIAGLWRYPVKSMQGEAVDAVLLSETGLAGDRHWAVRDRTTDKVLSAKRWPRLLEATARMDGSRVIVELPSGGPMEGADPAVSAVLSEWLGLDVSLEEASVHSAGAYEFQIEGDETAEIMDIACPDGTFLDFGAVHLITTSSMAAVRAGAPDLDWDLRRFRPTVLVTTSGDGFVEDSWVNGSVAIGDAQAYITIPTVRCAIPMRAQPGLVAAPAVMRHLKLSHNALLGVYGAVTLAGRVGVGNAVTVL